VASVAGIERCEETLSRVLFRRMKNTKVFRGDADRQYGYLCELEVSLKDRFNERKLVETT
jgi:hypothetical protein